MSDIRWTAENAEAWYRSQPWLVGCNFIPSTAINQLEMWQAATFDPDTIGRELGWAAGIGMNAVRVYLHDLVWQADAQGFKRRIDQYLALAAGRGIRTLFVLFDDCWNTEPKLGQQPEPIPGVHNSGWMQSPGSKIVTDPGGWARLERYVKDVLAAFAADERILMWDLYNEPGNNGLGDRSLALLQAAFGWARAVRPQQPLTAGVWFDNQPITDFQVEASDVITFHNYNDASSLSEQIRRLKALGRPVICTEYMARTRGSRFVTHLPIFKQEQVGCFNWGLVSGKTQTIYPWGSPPGGPEPELWFHDIFHKDGTPYDSAEVELIKKLRKE
jgi:hypothetical protein